MKFAALSLAALSFAFLSASAHADAVPYGTGGSGPIGTIAPTVPIYAASSGGINLYFYGSTAGFTDFVTVLDVNTGYSSGEILDNHTTLIGSETTVGTAPGQINAGDQIVFFINSPQGNLASIPSYSSDGVNHAYITNYSGGLQIDGNGAEGENENDSTGPGPVLIPAGLYVGMEDEAESDSDFNYNDDTFVFTGITAPSLPSGTTPEPSSLVLLGTGLLSAYGVARRKLTRG